LASIFDEMKDALIKEAEYRQECLFDKPYGTIYCGDAPREIYCGRPSREYLKALRRIGILDRALYGKKLYHVVEISK